jgi:hypothetical protein
MKYRFGSNFFYTISRWEIQFPSVAVRQVECGNGMASSRLREIRGRLLALAGVAIVAMVIVLALGRDTAVGGHR